MDRNLFDALFSRFSARINSHDVISHVITHWPHQFSFRFFIPSSVSTSHKKGLPLSQIGNDHEAAIGISHIALASFRLLLGLEHIILLLLSIIHIIEPQTAENETES